METIEDWLAKARIAVIGLGYVGLPLAVEFGKKFPVVGYDRKAERILALRNGQDDTLATSAHDLRTSTHLRFTDDPADLGDCNIYIVTVPTPVDVHKRPDLGPLLDASRTVGGLLQNGDTVIFESTVYPGCTEGDCLPVLERESGLRCNEDFTVGYSPERINPGDSDHRLTAITKVTSGSTPWAAECVDALYQAIIAAGTFRAESIAVAEAAKVIENIQRDLNIALMNDLAILFNRLGIDTLSVLEAAGTKWNFLPFRPGLVGGHCIGVDPYYLTHKAQEAGHHSDLILAGRRTNDAMGGHVAAQVIHLMLGKGISPVGARVLVMGLTFKENCPDLRNSRVIDIVRVLQEHRIDVEVHDPWVDAQEVIDDHEITLVGTPKPGVYDAIIIAVNHRQFGELGVEGIHALGKAQGHVVYDVKNTLPKGGADGRL